MSDSTARKVAASLGISYQLALQLKRLWWAEIKAEKARACNISRSTRDVAVTYIRERLSDEVS